MSKDLSGYSADELLRLLCSADDGESFSYEATWCLFKRWRRGTDLQSLIQLIESERTNERLRGAWYLEESCPPAGAMAETAIKLATDPLGYCRWAFVSYALGSGLYTDAVAELLGRCLFDLDLYVRGRTIVWAILAEEDQFEDFCRAVGSKSNSDEDGYFDSARNGFWTQSAQTRALRGLDIAKRLRAEEPLALIRESMVEEDSYIFDQLAFSSPAIERCIDKRKQKNWG